MLIPLFWKNLQTGSRKQVKKNLLMKLKLLQVGIKAE